VCRLQDRSLRSRRICCGDKYRGTNPISSTHHTAFVIPTSGLPERQMLLFLGQIPSQQMGFCTDNKNIFSVYMTLTLSNLAFDKQKLIINKP
jgi:hypothetical protein